ncbi:mitochondrial import inner membrane translocase subunit TIM13-like isoform X1 [Salvia hispanica]|uniref:mitochondrial import inner membrane translocase subunit TIM13-like isoform X1 n=1 Tax=Salvia hispanica TaxID=49212 RepID=UPI002009C518|nr:mitochondrial import inner membrane translocase subunit TIM13-like isoform X1 [Salvia hispanica]
MTSWLSLGLSLSRLMPKNFSRRPSNKDKVLLDGLSRLVQTVRGKCFDKCITKPGSSLSGSESSCISRCIDRYMEATGIIGKALFNQRH